MLSAQQGYAEAALHMLAYARLHLHGRQGMHSHCHLKLRRDAGLTPLQGVGITLFWPLMFTKEHPPLLQPCLFVSSEQDVTCQMRSRGCLFISSVLSLALPCTISVFSLLALAPLRLVLRLEQASPAILLEHCCTRREAAIPSADVRRSRRHCMLLCHRCNKRCCVQCTLLCPLCNACCCLSMQCMMLFHQCNATQCMLLFPQCNAMQCCYVLNHYHACCCVSINAMHADRMGLTEAGSEPTGPLSTGSQTWRLFWQLLGRWPAGWHTCTV